MGFPVNRPRRLRTTSTMRKLVAENSLSVNDLVYPLFTCPGSKVKEAIPSMAGCFHLSPDMIADEAREVAALGIPGVLLFGLAGKKDAAGSESADPDGAVQQSILAIKEACPDLLVMTDVCLCAYTDHGHCGVVNNGVIENDVTCGLLAEAALSHVRAGADVVAPSDMMDGRVGAIRKKLDENGFINSAIMSYSAKYASAFYGPFRDAAQSAPSEGDRKSYQMNPANSDEAIVEMRLDLEEGSDILMVKPGLPYLDVICRARREFDVPIAAYHVSGEYMCVSAAAEAGLIDRDDAMMESLMSLKRAGAGIIITYYAKEAARILK